MSNWWTKPQLRRDEEEGKERKVEFLELFYDLIFVVAIAQLAHDLAHHPDFKHMWQFALSFTAVWWLWIGNTFYTDRFETQDASHRLIVFLQMIPVVGLAVFAHGAYGDTALQFAVAYAVGRLMIIGLWYRGGYHDPEAKPVTDKYVAGFTIGLIPWVVSMLPFVDPSIRPALWALGLIIDISVPSLIRKHIHTLPKFSQSKLTERFGLFTIIVLGESVAGTVNGMGGLKHIDAAAQLTGLLAMVLAFQLWWIYFDMVPRERLKQTDMSLMLRSYLHLPLLAAIAASGAGVLGVLGYEGSMLGDHERELLAGSVGLALLSMVGLSRVHEYNPYFGSARNRTEGSLTVGAILCFILAFGGHGWGALQVLVLLILITLAPIAWGLYSWARIGSGENSEESDDLNLE